MYITACQTGVVSTSAWLQIAAMCSGVKSPFRWCLRAKQALQGFTCVVICLCAPASWATFQKDGRRALLCVSRTRKAGVPLESSFFCKQAASNHPSIPASQNHPQPEGRTSLERLSLSRWPRPATPVAAYVKSFNSYWVPTKRDLPKLKERSVRGRL